MNNQRTDDERFMLQALRLARRGIGKTNPNPLVGAVIVRNNQVIGHGYHHYFGGAHAEIDAIRNVGEQISGAAMYVTLEPCFHYGKTPPCVDAIVREGIGRVVIGMVDPDKRVGGRSIEKLRSHGIETTVGVLEGECRSLNKTYVKHRTTGLPFVTLKFAQTLDGRIATAKGDSRWISSEESRRRAHRLRSQNDAILVGIGTVLADNPELTVRLVKGRNPVRVVLDSSLKIPLDAKVLANQDTAKTMVVTTLPASNEKIVRLRDTGIEVLTVPPDKSGKVDLNRLLKILGERDVTSVLVEGGAATITSFLRLGLADRLVVFIASKILGKGTEAVGELDIKEIQEALNLRFDRVYRSGVDIVVEADIGDK